MQPVRRGTTCTAGEQDVTPTIDTNEVPELEHRTRMEPGVRELGPGVIPVLIRARPSAGSDADHHHDGRKAALRERSAGPSAWRRRPRSCSSSPSPRRDSGRRRTQRADPRSFARTPDAGRRAFSTSSARLGAVFAEKDPDLTDDPPWAASSPKTRPGWHGDDQQRGEGEDRVEREGGGHAHPRGLHPFGRGFEEEASAPASSSGADLSLEGFHRHLRRGHPLETH